MLKKCIKYMVIWTFLVSSFSFASLRIEINQGMNKPFPIAVVPFSGASVESKLISVVSRDLMNSGRFQVASRNQLPQQPSQPAQINWNMWSSLGTEYMLVGSVVPTAPNSGKYNVTFQLVSQLGNQALTGRVFKNVSSQQFVALGHTIADYIYQTITGQRGYFTTKLAYIDVSHPYDLRRAQYSLIVSDYDGQNPQVLLRQKRNPLASPVWSADGSKLAYVSYVNGRMAVYTIELRTGKRTLVANYPGINSSPAFDPVSKILAVALSKAKNSATTQLYLTKPKANGIVKQLTYSGTNTSPAFSPSGKSVAFTSTRGGQPQIYMMRINDLSAKRLTFSGTQNFDPKFTPDGKYIIFMHQATRGGSIEIAKLNLQTNKITTLTKGPVDKSPSIAPNGNMIIYTKTHSNGSLGLAMVSLDGSIHINLPAVGSAVNIQSPAWSPFLG